MANNKASKGKRQFTDNAASPFEVISQFRQHRVRQIFDQAKRATASAKTRHKVLSSMMKDSGVDLAKIDQQHQREWDLVLRRADRQQRAAVALLKQQRVRQREAFRTVMEHRDRFEYKKGNPHTSICLWRAIAAPDVLVTVQTFSDGIAQLTRQPESSFRTGDNSIRLIAETIGAVAHGFHFTPVAAMELTTEHFFEGTMPHDGLLSVTAAFAPLGTIFLGAPGDCILNGDAGAEMLLYMRIIINPRSGLGFELPFGDTITIVDDDVNAGCDGASKQILVGGTHAVAHQLSRDNAVEVHAGDVVRVIAGYDMHIASSLRGVAMVNFFPSPLGFNVPMVLLRING
ncbi:MAG TPA: hypothetical protein VLR92_10085 [Blastocatellia bacterium]|nr:hypothetical protein [Blastocatellia bacterium]